MLLISTNLQFDNLNHSIIRTQVWQHKCLDYRASTVADKTYALLTNLSPNQEIRVIITQWGVLSQVQITLTHKLQRQHIFRSSQYPGDWPVQLVDVLDFLNKPFQLWKRRSNGHRPSKVGIFKLFYTWRYISKGRQGRKKCFFFCWLVQHPVNVALLEKTDFFLPPSCFVGPADQIFSSVTTTKTTTTARRFGPRRAVRDGETLWKAAFTAKLWPDFLKQHRSSVVVRVVHDSTQNGWKRRNVRIK